MINADPDICRQWSGILHTYIVKKMIAFSFYALYLSFFTIIGSEWRGGS